LRIALLELCTILVVSLFILLVVGRSGINIDIILGERGGEEVLIFEACRAKDVVFRRWLERLRYSNRW